MQKLLAGELTLKEYQTYLVLLLPIYQALEHFLEGNKKQAILAPIYLPALFRSEHLLKDINMLNAFTQPLLCSQNRFTLSSPEEAIAIFYVRYFGDISGGQIIKKKLSEQYDTQKLPTNFYQFDLAPPSGIKTIDYLRSCVNSLPLNKDQKDKTVSCSIDFFEYNIFLMNKALKKTVLQSKSP